jgi:hypothetical protein
MLKQTDTAASYAVVSFLLSVTGRKHVADAHYPASSEEVHPLLLCVYDQDEVDRAQVIIIRCFYLVYCN